VVYLLENTPETIRLIGKKLMIYDYPDGTIDIKHCGKSFKCTVFDKLRTVNEAAITDNKRLGGVLKFAKVSQDSDAAHRARPR
ncbi:ISNCY family transposase, partial [Aliivibrio sp. S4TY2]|nr:ISNCY family transposase [Aliivibrio sp. S4TY2]MDD9162433.1 ISNCY family transposase [Aliivibrio sp. S4TY1]MDD9166440.1 ISNCY family transposase [Aliivibrio sp. S4MY2]MDD9170430.1 ISNCY family transposase [Aliivibrio sp. S4MY4]MDD9187519.1 ISNCY family transposase [Aliivibrio sp. S4MY3]MDD9197433.1 ISNCY family transposase [Aliivibrio sp. S3MY1]MDD9204700.1 ISNCY family transposase [Aliivibrio sp. S4MY1]